MSVGVVDKSLSPGVKDRENAWEHAAIIARKSQDGVGGSAQQKRVDFSRVRTQ